jgi:choline dehydrogenase-like flavoprotein
VDRSKQVIEAAGGKVVASFAPVRNTGWHLMGTARMGQNLQDSVVNAFGQAHGVKNLFIVDSSIFVTGAAVNPVATAQALTLYICDHIERQLGSLLC